MRPQQKLILLSLVIGVLLMVAKFVAWFITRSNVILSDAAESIVNVLASAFAYYSVYLSALPRDENHPYGHGKVEFFSAFIEGALIGIAGLSIALKSTYNLFYPEPVNDLLTGTFIVIAAGAVNGLLGVFLQKRGRELHSITIEADGKHLISDAVTSVAMIAGLLLIWFTKIAWLDSAISVAMGVYLLIVGYRLVRRSVGGLMDEADAGIVEEFISVLNKNRQDPWIDLHNLRAQQYGPDLHIDCHMTLPNYFDLKEVHREVSTVDALGNGHFKRNIEFFIHADPCLPECCHYCRMKNCPIRSEEQRMDITWTLANATENKKHFEQELARRGAVPNTQI
ncbi:MAG: cation transporter [Mucilaginibacter polytrichastri]|nr:cation transporter [Mucilaginibacter polytrichastri]